MTETIIRKLNATRLLDVDRCDGRFTVESRLVMDARYYAIHYRIEAVAPYEKRYPPEIYDVAEYVDHPDRAIFLAYLDQQLAGQIRLCRYWNRYAYIEDIVVDVNYRRRGIGRALIRQAIAWAQENGFPGIMLETQDNNVAGCGLYQSCGFTLNGFDTGLYRGIDPTSQEVALFWYLVFTKEGKSHQV
jgi:ribosomal protein S18 acetylase RimI-like enzyme